MKLRLSSENPLLKHHRVNGEHILPGVAYIDVIFRAAEKAGLDFRATELRNLVLFQPCVVAPDRPLELTVEITATEVLVAAGSAKYATAELHAVAPTAFGETLPPADGRGAPLESAYSLCRGAGLFHEGFMKADGEVQEEADGYRLSVRLGNDAAAASHRFLFHPVLLDAAVLGTSGLMAEVMPTRGGELALPVIYGAFRAVEPLRADCQARCRRSTIRSTGGMVSTDVEFFDADGRKIAELRGIVHKRKGASRAEPRLTEIFARKLRVPAREIDIHRGFYDLGLDSTQMLEIVEELGRVFHKSLAPTLLFEHTTVAGLQAHFAAMPATPSAAPVSPVAAREPVAVIGLSGRYPMANSVAELWKNLLAGKDCITEIPPERWERSRLDGITSSTGKPLSRWGGFVDDADCFDAKFFHISPREAELMDPQERLFLQAVWEAIEDSGYRPDTLVEPRGPERRNKVGVFAGLMHNDYQGLASVENAKGNPTPVVESYATVVNRAAYVFNFHGPNLAVDTACSSSLTALHLAVESLQSGASEVALAGGVNLSFNPDKYITYGLANMHSTDGRCRTFGDGGDGYVSAEGVGVAVLKPLSRAIRDGDRIYAVVKATEINHGGRASGVTVPNPTAQADLIATCLEKAGTPARTIGCIEAHGTGTSLGDPIEFAGLVKAFRASTADAQFCAIGSIKSNIGHAEGAAGIAGFTKLALQLHHRTLAPSLHADALNPHIDFATSPFFVQRTAAAWKQDGDTPRRAGISSFGAGGSNAHIVLEEAPAAAETRCSGTALIVLSAKSEERLRIAARNLRDHLAATSEVELDRVARTLQLGRVPMEHRLAVVATDCESVVRKLSAWLEGAEAEGVWQGEAGGLATATGANSLDAWAAAWVGGWEPDWNRLYTGGKPRPVSLPHYPFAKTRYWIAQTAPSHRLRLAASDFWAQGHEIGGRALVPGAAYLEIVRAAAKTRRLRNVLWTKPLDLSGGPKTIDIHVSGQQVDVVDESGARLFQCEADSSAPEAPARLDLAAIRGRCEKRLAARDFYAHFERLGIHYGEAFQPVKSLAYGEGEALAELRAPTRHGVELHPSSVDGAFQSMLGLLLGGPLDEQLVPFGLQELVLHRAPAGTVYAYARGGARRCDIVVSDPDGIVCLELRGYEIRALAKANPVADVFFATSGWERVAAPRGAAAKIVTVRGPEVAPAASFASQAEAWFQAVLAAIRERLNTETRFIVLCPDSVDEVVTAPVAALLRTARLEHPRISGVLLRYPAAWTASRVDELVRAEAAGTDVREVRYLSSGIREERRVRTLAAPRAGRFRQNGVYWITGGGALGRLFATHLTRRYSATVILSGRHEYAAGDPKIHSIRCDVSVRAEVEAAYRQIREQFGELHGIFHNAGVLDDGYVAEKTPEQVRRVFAAKAYGAAWLDEVLGDAPLDFIAYASSGAGVLGNAGQCDYAGANAFLDRWAERRGNAVSISWPLWAEGGMRVDGPTAERLRRATGMTPLETEQGLACLEQAIGAGVSHVIVAAGDVARIRKTFLPEASAVTEAAPSIARADVERAIVEWTSRILKVPAAEIELGATLDEHGFDSIMLAELTNCINEGFDVNWTPAIFFETPSLAALVDRLSAEAAPAAAAPNIAPENTPPDDAIAVVGMAARLPQSPTLRRFWEHLPRADDRAVRRLHRRRRQIRPAVLRHLATRSPAHGPAAAGVPRNCVGCHRGRGLQSEIVCRIEHRAVRGRLLVRLQRPAEPGGGRGRGTYAGGSGAFHSGESRVVPARPARAERACRYGVFEFARRAASGGAQSPSRRLRPGDRGRRQSPAESDRLRRVREGRHAESGRTL
jgi:acyl transferase domain-containing protein/NAD(P)-dependent dehydrogenase (short-subunit alcohol dehydrogenase family)/acyl carrier protein